jgi:hypothetical protein
VHFCLMGWRCLVLSVLVLSDAPNRILIWHSVRELWLYYRGFLWHFLYMQLFQTWAVAPF